MSASEDIAIIGCQLQLPGANSLEQLWENLVKKNFSVTEIPSYRWDWREHFGDPTKPGKVSNVKYGAFIEEIDQFDASFFNITPREAVTMDPRQRLLLQGTWQLIENAGYHPEHLSGLPVSVFIGANGDEYEKLLQQHLDDVDSYTLTGTSRSALANRISFFYHFTAASEVIDAACSGSLVAVDHAVQSLLTKRAKLSIAGGINLTLEPNPHIALDKIGMLAKDGKCKTFSKEADGYVRGEGYVLLLLKPLRAAESDNDHILAVIKASAVNHDGRSNSFTAPNPQAQAALLTSVYEQAQVSPDNIGYLEAHGTGTALGDPIEIDALNEFFEKIYKKYQRLPEKNVCAVGSIKTNIGHLEAAAGIAGLVKAMLVLQKKQIPASLHLEELNPYIEQRAPIYFPKELQAWSPLAGDAPRVAGVSSFGFGGVNAHVVLADYSLPDLVDDNRPCLVVLSAPSEQQLRRLQHELRVFLQSPAAESVNLASIAYTLQVGRKSHAWRVAYWVESKGELVTALEQGHSIAANPTLKGTKKETLETHNLRALAQRWLQGQEIDWARLPQQANIRRVPLPGYQFNQKSYWYRPLTTDETTSPFYKRISQTDDELKIVVDTRSSEIREHIVNGSVVFPGVAYLILLKESLPRLLDHRAVMQLNGFVWLRPLIVRDPEAQIELVIRKKLKGEGQYSMTIFEAKSGPLAPICKATLTDASIPLPHFRQESFKTESTQRLDQAQIVTRLIQLGFHHRDYYLALDTMTYSRSFSLSTIRKLRRPLLNCALLDCLLQSSILFEKDPLQTPRHPSHVKIPYCVDRIVLSLDSFNDEVEENLRIHTCVSTHSDTLTKHDIRLINNRGEVLIFLQGLYGREATVGKTDSPEKTDSPQLNYYQEKWCVFEAEGKIEMNTREQEVLLLLPPPTMVEELKAPLSKYYKRIASAILTEESPKELSLLDFSFNFNKVEDFEWLFTKLRKQNFIPNTIILFVCGENSSFSFNNLFNPVKILFHLNSMLFKYFIRENTSVVVVTVLGRGSKLSQAAHQALDSVCLNTTLEHKRFKEKYLYLGNDDQIQTFIKQLHEPEFLSNFLSSDDRLYSFKYRNKKLHYKQLSEVELQFGSERIHFHSGGTYFIAGGSGALSQKIVKYMASQVKANFVLAGRRQPDDSIRELISELHQLGSNVEYVSTDITNKSMVRKLIRNIRKKYSAINGIIHCAGLIGDSLLINKKISRFMNVLYPKISGTVYLDEETAKDELDFFMVFSSLVAYVGHVGQTDYAYANAFLNHYINVRADLCEKGMRQGRSISISWSLWENGGMKITEEESRRIRKKVGVLPLPDEIGIQVFSDAFKSQWAQQIITYGHPELIRKHLIKNFYE